MADKDPKAPVEDAPARSHLTEEELASWRPAGKWDVDPSKIRPDRDPDAPPRQGS